MHKKFVSVIQQDTNWCAGNGIKWYIAVMTNDYSIGLHGRTLESIRWKYARMTVMNEAPRGRFCPNLKAILRAWPYYCSADSITACTVVQAVV